MIKTRMARFIDTLFLSFIFFLFVLSLLNRLKLDLIYRLMLASILSFVFFKYILNKSKKKFSEEQLKLSEQKHMKNCFLYLASCSGKERNNFFNSLFNILVTEKTNNNLNPIRVLTLSDKQNNIEEILQRTNYQSYALKPNRKRIYKSVKQSTLSLNKTLNLLISKYQYLTCTITKKVQNVLVYIDNLSETTSKSTISYILSSISLFDKVYLISNKLSPASKELLDYYSNQTNNKLTPIDIQVLSESDMYLIFKSQDKFPVTHEHSQQKFTLIKLKNSVYNLFTRSSSKKLFFIGFLLILSSLFVPFKSYYITFASIFMLLAFLGFILSIFKKA